MISKQFLVVNVSGSNSVEAWGEEVGKGDRRIEEDGEF